MIVINRYTPHTKAVWGPHNLRVQRSPGTKKYECKENVILRSAHVWA